jgi:hypothetical protein
LEVAVVAAQSVVAVELVVIYTKAQHQFKAVQIIQ